MLRDNSRNPPASAVGRFKIALASISINGGTQSRAAIDAAVVAEYVENIDALPAVMLFHDGTDYWLADGFHRHRAHVDAGRVEIEAIVRQGSRRDAILYSVGANSAHGLRRSNDDKRRAVETLLADAEWSAWSDRAIAKAAGVSHTFVQSIRNSHLATLPDGEGESRTVERSGTTYQQSRKKKGPRGPNPESVGERKVDAPAAAVHDSPSPLDAFDSEEYISDEPAAQAAGSAPPPADPRDARIAELETQVTELASNLEEALADIASMSKVFDANDQVVLAVAEAKKYREQARLLDERVTGLTNEKNQYVRLTKHWKGIAEKLQKTQRVAA